VNSNPYKSAVEHIEFDEAFDEKIISLITDAAKRKKTIPPFQIPKSSWRYIAAAAGIILLFIAVPLIRGPQNTNETTAAAVMTAAGCETTTAAVMTAAGCETTVKSDTTQNDAIALITQPSDVYEPGTVIENGTVYVSSTADRLKPYSMNELVNVADNIFTGLCVYSGPIFQNDTLYTISEVQITEVLKGSLQAGDIVSVLEMGGRTTIGELRNETSEEIKDFDHYDDSISTDTKFVEGIDGFYPLKVDDKVLLFTGDTSGFLANFTEPLYYPYGDYEGKMYLRKDNVYARNTPSNTDVIVFDDKSVIVSLDELNLLIAASM